MTKLEQFKLINESSVAIPDEMDALILSGKGFEHLQLKRVPVPQPGANQFLARVDAVFGCASDSKLIENGKEHPLLYGWDIERWPISIGHEACITAVKIGDNLKEKISVGATYALQPAINSRPITHRERYANPASIDKVAIGYSLGGMFAEYILIPEEVIQTNSLISYDTTQIPYFAAAFTEPLSCVYSAQNQVSHIYKDGPLNPREVKLGLKRGGVTLILGAGPMGIIHSELAMTYKPQTIILSEPLEMRRRQAKQIIHPKAANRNIEFILTTPDELPRVLQNVTKGRGVDDCISSLGIAKVQEESLNYLAKGGVANFFGGTKVGESVITVDTRRIHYDSITMVGSSGGDPSDVHAVMKLIEKREISPELYVKRVGGLNAALELVKSIRAQDFFGKGLIYPHIRHDLSPVDAWSYEKENEFLEAHLS
ncbi:zinc-binding dehydrogenase [candidate division KSB1 bacterium]|nr:zinc-binding dehydrogenase [candidate division KSB1 bacterium]